MHTSPRVNGPFPIRRSTKARTRGPFDCEIVASRSVSTSDGGSGLGFPGGYLVSRSGLATNLRPGGRGESLSARTRSPRGWTPRGGGWGDNRSRGVSFARKMPALFVRFIVAPGGWGWAGAVTTAGSAARRRVTPAWQVSGGTAT